MTNATPGAVDSTLHDGLSAGRVLAVGAFLGLVGWMGTQYVAWNPGLALGAVGVEGTTLVILYWLFATVGMAGVIFGAGSRAVAYNPLIWGWGVLVAVAMATNGAVVVGLVPASLAGYALWHPWIAVYAIGYSVTGLVTADRRRTAYLGGGLLALLAFGSWLAFPLESQSWLFALTGVVHAGPMIADALFAPTAAVSSAAARDR